MFELVWLILIPAAGGLVSWIVSRWNALAVRIAALSAALLELALAARLWIGYSGSGSLWEYKIPWIPKYGISFYFAMDGISLLMVALTSFLGVIAVACSWREITDRIGIYHLAAMCLLSGIVGVFLARDLFLLYFFWELMLVPMYFLIGFWGHENRLHAAVKFFLFTFVSGLFMLAAIIGLYVLHGRATGTYTFDYSVLAVSPVGGQMAFWLMLGFFVGFAVKLPMFPFHTWLPDAHTQAPTAGSVILAGLMLKTGAYGLYRFAIPLFPDASELIRPAAMLLAAVGIIYGAVLAFSQRDFKRMVAYTSVSHLGFVLLGLYAGTQIALKGAVMEMVCHGISTGALFLIAGMIQERTHTRDISKLGGLWAVVPRMGGFTMLFSLAALGLPGLGNFVGEFLILLGVFTVNPILAVTAGIGIVLSAVYGLKLIQTSMFGPNDNNWAFSDLRHRETWILASLAAAIIVLGLYPKPVLDTVDVSSAKSAEMHLAEGCKR